MGNKITYSEMLTDPRWQRKRLDIFQRDGFSCVECGASDKKLNVHHLYYVSGREPWNYQDAALKTLCDDCHDARARAEKLLIMATMDFTADQLEKVAEFLYVSCRINSPESLVRFFNTHEIKDK